MDVSQLNQTVASVLADVKQRGDEAVKGYELKFDHVDLPSLEVTKAEIKEIVDSFAQSSKMLKAMNRLLMMIQHRLYTTI